MKYNILILFLLCSLLLYVSSCSDNSTKEENTLEKTSERAEETSEETAGAAEKAESGEKTYDYSMVLGESLGAITKESTKEQLLEVYGAENINFEERMFMDEPINSSSLFKGTENVVVIYWTDNTYSQVSSVELMGEKGEWSTKEGLKLGSTIKEVEAVNGKAFKLYGFYGAEGSGINESWEDGAIGSNVQINFGGGIPEESEMDKELLYENKVSSDNAKLQAINPTVISIGFYF